MENKSCQGNPGPSRKSDLIIITPDELAKLGLIPEIIHTSTACEKPRNETDGGAVKEKQKRKMCKTYITKNTEENTFDAKIEGKKLVNFENNNEQDVSHTKQDKPHPVTFSPKTINRKFKNINKSSKINKNYNRSNDKVSSNNRNQEKNLSSSEDGKNLKNIEEFKQTMKKSLSKKFQEFSKNTDCDIETYVSEHKINTTYQDLEMKGDDNLIKNTENNLVKVDKGVKIIGNSPICLSNRELKRLVSKSNRLPSGKNVFVSKKNITGFDKKETEENFECKDHAVFKNVSLPSSTIRAAEKKPSKKLAKIEQVEKKIKNNVHDVKGHRRTEQKTATELKKENKSPVNKGSHSSTDDGDTSQKIISSENIHGDDKLSKKETVIDNIENVITECKEYKNTGENCGGMNKEQKKMIDIDETSAHSEDSDKKRSAQENTAKRNELEDSKMIEIHKEEMTHDQKLDDANVITKEKEANKVEHNETSAEECYVDENISQNIGKNPPPPKCEKLLQKEEKSPCKTSITIPKKRKYVMNFTVDGVTEKVTRTKEMKNTKSGQDNVNVATETGKNSPNKDLTTNTKRKKTSKIMMHDVLLKQGELEQNVENNSPESSNSNNYKTDLNDNHEENTQNKSCLITNKPKKNYTELSQINGNELSETEMSVKDEIKNKIDIKSIDVEESKTSTESSKTNSNISNNNVHKNEEIETSGNYSKKINNESNELSKQNVKLPKKRGRPKKISDTKDDNSPISDAKEDTSVISVVDLDIEEIVASTPLPKKRGRKKRVEQPVPVEVEEDIELDESRSGRKRKRINYLELVNELEGSNEDAHKRKIKFSIHNIERAKPDKRQRTDDQVENRQGDFNLSENSTSSHPEMNNPDGSMNGTDSSDKNNENQKKSKYRRTGETTMMMNSMFAAAFKNKSVCETESDSNISNEASSSNTAPVDNTSHRGRKKKSLVNIIVDQDNMVTCVTCNEKLNNDDWEEHNRQEHNNLAWREGEPEIALDKPTVVVKILKPILKEDKEIKCKKCKNSFQTVNGFVGHIEKCCGVISSNGLVTCAVCKTEMEKKKWPNHKQRQHNNLAWRIGDRPLNLSDQNLVVSILTALYKAKKPLYCEKCGTSKKSVVGFLSHQSQCGVQVEEVKVKCQFCEKKVLPVSMQSHVKMIHETSKEKDVLQDASFFSVDTGTSLTKRKAAKTAMLVINKLSSERIVQEHSKHYLGQVNFSEEDFVEIHLKKELSSNSIVKCKFNNCSYQSDSVIGAIEHMNSCELKPEQYYTCKRCLSMTTTEVEMKEHVKNVHNIDIIDDEYEANGYEDVEDEMNEQYYLEMKRGSQHEKSKMERDPHYKAKPTFILNLSKRPCQLFSQAYNYTMSFCEQHYSTKGLFKNFHSLKTKWFLLDDSLIEEYLRHAQSCDVAKRKVKNRENVLGNEYTFKKFNLLESEHEEGIATMFCGGPIQAMAWLPTPYTSSDCRQVLAVASLNDFDKKYFVNQQYYDKSVIQFWDLGILKNKQPMVEPKLMFCLAHDSGPVWYLEWCPSGCYEEPRGDSKEMSRMGLLAVAGSESVVCIYSIPHFNDGEMGFIYKVKPSLKLHLNLDGEQSLNGQKFYATKISWGKASGHRYMAVGYTDGVVALFDLDATSNLLRCKDEDGCEVLLPFRSFQPHSHVVTVVDLIHLADGKRWLLTGSFDRNIIVWDLSNDFKITSKRNIISDGLWLTNWIAFISTADESSTKYSTVPTLLASYRDYLYDHVNLTTSVSSVKTISESSWLNGIIYCSAVGETTAMFPAQLVFGIDNDKKFKNSLYLFGYTKLINKHLSPEERLAEAKRKKILSSETNKKKTVDNEELISTENDKYEPITYQEASEKYGLLFCDAKMDSFGDLAKEDKKAKSNEEPDVSKANLYPMQAINKVAYNPNLQASLYYATGYQAGFVRVIYMKFLEKDLQIK